MHVQVKSDLLRKVLSHVDKPVSLKHVQDVLLENHPYTHAIALPPAPGKVSFHL